MSNVRLSQINIFPIKSTKGIRLSSAWTESEGLSFDRRFMIALKDGTMVTARKFPQLVKVVTSLQSDGICLSYPDMSTLSIKYSAFSMEPFSSHVWSDEFKAGRTVAKADAWLSHILGQPAVLLYLGDASPRFSARANQAVSFADGFPLLVISKASLTELNQRSTSIHHMDQFRTNLVVEGCEAFDEDSWKRIKIGEVEFEARGGCSRCVLTTVDATTGELNEQKEPLTTLSKFRADETGKVYFGQNLVALNEGVIKEGDGIEILEFQPMVSYPDSGDKPLVLTCVEREDLAKDFSTFWLEPTKGVELPNYQPGQHLPIQIEINGEYVARRYTLSSSPSRPGRYAISVKRVADGRISNWLHDNFRVGDSMVAQTPDGAFHLGETTDKLLLLSGGSGVTPMLSMLRYLADHNEIKDVVFYHQCRTKADIPALAELKTLADKHSGLTVKIALTGENEVWTGLTGRLSAEHLTHIAGLPERQVFVCGPEAFMNSSKELLLSNGVSEQHYHQETFGPVSGKETEAKELTISINGYLFQGNNQQTLLEQAENAGVALPYSCRSGFCGACKMEVESGDVDQPDVPALLPGEREQGTVLACCCRPQSDVELVN